MSSKIFRWGIMIPIGKLKPGKIDLMKQDYTFGISNSCDYQIQDDPSNPNPYYKDYSGHHFHLEKGEMESGTVCYIHDQSDSGTWVNGKRLGKRYGTPLEPNSEISLVSADNKVFIFIVENHDDLIPDIIRSNYIVSKTLGKGAFGEVRLLFTQDGKTRYAMKGMRTLPTYVHADIEQKREIQIMQSIKHPCIIEIIETFDNPDFLFIVMELAEGGTLESRLRQEKTLKESTTRIIIHQVLLAVEYLHKEGITHRDLKPDNILLASESDETLVKVTDFGVSKAVNDATMMATFAGTPVFIAPEMWGKLLGEVSNYSNAVDVWSIGIIMFRCITGGLPITIRNHNEYIRDKPHDGTITQKFRSVEFFDKPHAKDLGLKLLKVEPARRISVEDALKHDWFQDEQSIRRVEELTGLTLVDSGKTAVTVLPSKEKPLSDKDKKIMDPADNRGTQFEYGSKPVKLESRRSERAKSREESEDYTETSEDNKVTRQLQKSEKERKSEKSEIFSEIADGAKVVRQSTRSESESSFELSEKYTEGFHSPEGSGPRTADSRSFFDMKRDRGFGDSFTFQNQLSKQFSSSRTRLENLQQQFEEWGSEDSSLSSWTELTLRPQQMFRERTKKDDDF